MATRTWAGDDATTPYDWSVAGNWVEGSVPVSTDDVVIPAGSQKITAGLNQSAVTLNSLTVNSGYVQSIGASSGALQVAVATGTNVFLSPTGGTQYFDFGASAVDVEVLGTGSPSTGFSAVNVVGSALDVVTLYNGSLGIARIAGETATVTTLNVNAGALYTGSGATVTNLNSYGGSTANYSGATTIKIYGGTVNAPQGTNATVNVIGGTFRSSSSSTITTLNLDAGLADFSVGSVPRTVTTVNVAGERDCTLAYDPGVLTITTLNQPSRPYTLSWRV